MAPLGMVGDATTTEATAPCLDPVRKLRHLDCVTTNTADDAPPELRSPNILPVVASISTTPSLSRREYCTSESGSPTRVQSPLRYSVSHTERPELPFPLITEQAMSTDPTKSPVDAICNMALTGDKRRQPIPSTWLTGAPTSGFSSEMTPTKLRTPSQMSRTDVSDSPKTTSTTPNSASPFSFLSTALRGLTSNPTASPRPIDDDDDLMSLNIDQTLHSMTSLTDRSTFSPAAFKNLQMVATGLLHKFQDAYKQRTMEVRELRAEQAAQHDEQGEMGTKMQHLRLQLEGMAQKAAEQEEMMRALMAELAREKKLRIDQSVHMPRGSIASEDLGVEEDQRTKWKKGGSTARSDTSYDTDEEGTEEASVFSTRSRSPTLATIMSDQSSIDSQTYPPQALPTSSKAAAIVVPSKQNRAPQGQMTTFQKLFRGLSAEGSTDGEIISNCRNCQGQDIGVAWDTVNLLKDENKGLKHRVCDLEGALESALDAVNGVGL